MTARPSRVDVSETAKMKTSSTRSSSENTDAAAVDDSTDLHDAHIADALNSQPTIELSYVAATADGNASQRLKKSSFQITRIVQAETAGDGADDVDDTTSAEDLGSSLEGAKTTNAESDARWTDAAHSPSSVEEVESLASCQKQHLSPNPSRLVRTQPSDINSRFKIVKIESNKPLRRGRWICFEFVDPPQLSVPPEKVVRCSDSASTGSLIASPIYYIQVEKEDPSKNPFAAIVYSDGQPSLDPNPLPFAESSTCPGSCSIASKSHAFPASTLRSADRSVEPSKETSSLSSETNDRRSEPTKSGDQIPIPSPHVVLPRMLNSLPDDRRGSTLVNGVSCGSDEMIRPDDEDQDVTVTRTGSEPSFVHSKVSEAMSSTLFAIVPTSANVCANGFAENDISGEICALDNKIEQAMDLVKSHLMFAVHEEVELLKDQIKELMIKKGQLEYENKVLRESATPETLEKLHPDESSPPTSLS